MLDENRSSVAGRLPGSLLLAALVLLAAPRVEANWVLNGGFEDGADPGRAWVQDSRKTGDKGAIARDAARVRSGQASLRMEPNRRNGPPQQLAVSQEITLGPYRGKQVELSADMFAEGDARALAGLLVVGREGTRLLQLEQVGGGRDWVRRTRVFDLPADPSARYFLALWVDGQGGAAWFDDVAMGPPGTTKAAPGPDSAPNPLARPGVQLPIERQATLLAGAYDPWNPPLGEAVRNLAMSEGWTDARLVAPPVNVTGNGGWTDSVTATRDGKRLYFGYTKWDYFIFESTQQFVVKGPARTSSYSGNELQIYQAELGSSGWTVALHPVNLGSEISAASMGVNLTEDLMVYNTYEFKPRYRTSMRLATRANSTWTRVGALPAPINSPAGCLDDNGYVIGTLAGGYTLYFESTRASAEGGKCGKDRHLHFATYQNGSWSAVRAVPGVNSAAGGDSDMQPFVSEDKQRIYWLATRPSQGKYGIFAADWNGSTYANPRMIVGIQTFTRPWAGKVVRIGEPNVVELPQGKVMYFMCGIALGDTSRGEPDDIQYKVCFARRPN